MNSFTSEALRIITYVIIKQVLVGPGAGGVKYSAVYFHFSDYDSLPCPDLLSIVLTDCVNPQCSSQAKQYYKEFLPLKTIAYFNSMSPIHNSRPHKKNVDTPTLLISDHLTCVRRPSGNNHSCVPVSIHILYK